MSFHVFRLCVLSVCFCAARPNNIVNNFDAKHLTFAVLLIAKSKQSVAVIANQNALNNGDEDDDDIDIREIIEENVQEVLEVPMTGEYEDDNKPSKEQEVQG